MTNTLDLNTLDLPVIELEDGQLVTDALLVVRSMLDGGRTRYTTVITNHTDYGVAIGMVTIGADAIGDGDLFTEDQGL